MGGVSLACTVILLVRKKSSVYGAIAMSLTVFLGLLLLDTAVFIRYFGFLLHGTGRYMGIAFDRLLHGSMMARSEVISNVVVFVPFGFFLVLFWAIEKHYSIWPRILLGTLVAFGLSFCIECLQMVLHVGYFEVMDLILNTAGGFVGAVMATVVKASMTPRKGERNHSL